VVVVLVALAYPASSGAQSATARAMVLYREANQHYNLGQLELAADKYRAAISADPQLPGPYRNLGLTYRALGKYQLAITHFKKYLALRPHGRHSARVQKEMQYCLGQVGGVGANVPTGAAHVMLHVSEPGAEVKIDRVARGATPTPPLPVQPGSHTVSVAKRGFLSWSGTVQVSEGQVAEVSVKLQRDPNARDFTAAPIEKTKYGVLRVENTPALAQLVLSGREIRLNDELEARVPVGQHTLEITKGGLKPWRTQIEVKENQTISLSPDLEVTSTTRVLRRWGWVTVGTAGALAVAGLVLGLVENRTFQEIKQYDRGTGSRAELQDLLDKQRTQSLLANVMYGLSGAALCTGIVLFAITPELSKEKDGGLRAMVRGRFSFE
jgi:hypothetical protein